MVSVPLGKGAYRREYAGAPEVRLLNRWLEKNPTNLKEGTSVLGRPGTTPIHTFNQGSFTGNGAMRGCYALGGLFNDSLFVVCGNTLYRIKQDMSITQISGTINGTGHPEIAWQKGAGYERLWIIDGLLLQYYSGTSYASGNLVKSGTIVNGTDTIQVAGVYYTWGTVFNSTDNGSAAHPFVVNPTPTSGPLNPMAQLILAVNASGTPGVDYSATLTGANVSVSAAAGDTLNPTQNVLFTALASGTGGNSITTVVTGGTALSFPFSTLQNGGIEALTGCTIPGGQVPSSITQLASYIIVSIANTQTFYWVNPGETTMNALNFASKESNPDNIVSLRTIGDQMAVIGTKSFENWYATGDSLSPFAPIEGRVYARGSYPGTAVIIDETMFLVGDDGRVYSIGSQSGDATDAGWGVARISDNGIEERIRKQIRREQGLTP